MYYFIDVSKVVCFYETCDLGKKNFECTVCKKKYFRKKTLDSHFVSHTGKLNFLCIIDISIVLCFCKTYFLGEKNFECTVCNKKFFVKSNLDSHFVMHTGKLNFPHIILLIFQMLHVFVTLL